jgi:selenocysteine-specific elongation factor
LPAVSSQFSVAIAGGIAKLYWHVMKSVIIGTAGHVDHGKTALVKALTGIDADRLEEEKRRGITIDIGFAHLDLALPGGDTLRLGFVDVPGHERFVRNMLAGVGGIDLVLLVIAADESIKPQTREHFDICRLLSVRRGIVVLTKSDLVDRETLDVVRMEVEEFLRDSFLDSAHSAVVAVSAMTGAGLEELRQAIVRVGAEIPAKDSAALARLPIDRVFTMKGFGVVVTGTLLSGTVRKEDELEVLPAGRRVRVRGVQVHGRTVEEALAGQRTALNLAGTDTGDLWRGMTLAPPGTFKATQRVDAKLWLLGSVKRPLKNRTQVHFHSNTMETVAEIELPNAKKEIVPGSETFVRLKLPETALLLPGDRFIIRQFSPLLTIGGGVVVDGTPISRSVQVDDTMEILAGGDRRAILKIRIWRGYHDGIWLAQLVEETGWTKSAIESELADVIRNGEVVRIGEMFMHAPAWELLKSQVVPTVADFHRENPLASGIGKEELRDRTDAGDEAFEAITEILVREQKIEISGDLVRLPGQGVVMKDEEAESKKTIETAFASAGLKVPALNDVLAGLKVDRVRAQKIVTLLLRDKVLVKLSEDLVFHRTALEDLRRRVASEKIKSANIDVAHFKDLAGVSRKYAIPLLEYLDREHVTRRVGDVRVIL